MPAVLESKRGPADSAGMLRRTAIGLLLVLLGAFAAFEGYVWTQRADGPPVDDADLVSRWKPVPDETNARVRLLALAIPFDASRESGDPLRDVREKGGWDRALARAYLAPHAEVLAAVDPAVAAPVYQPAHRRRGIPTVEEIDRESETGGRTLWLGELIRFASIDLAHAGDGAAALDGHLRALRFHAREITMPGAGSDEVIYGLSGYGGTVAALRTSLAHLRPDAAESRRREREIEALRVPADAWRSFLREDYLHTRAVLSTPRSEDAEGWAQWLIPGDYSLQVNRSITRVADTARTLIASADRPCTERPPQAPGWKLPSGFDWLTGIAPETAAFLMIEGALLKRNADGDFIAEISASTSYQLDTWRCYCGSVVSAAQALIALRAYQVEHGELPATLDALVPDYLSRVPTDGYDGAPLRYSRDKKLLWTIGDDLEDDGGAKPPEDEPWRNEPSWEIAF